MEVILTQEIDKLGSKDEIVTVKSGYARNYLVPQGLAKYATESAKKVLAENIRQRSHKESKIREEAEAIASKLEGMEIKIGAKAGETGKIFGSVNTIQLAEAIQKAGLQIDRKQISIKTDTIKELGTYQANVRLHKEVNQEISFEVIAE